MKKSAKLRRHLLAAFDELLMPGEEGGEHCLLSKNSRRHLLNRPLTGEVGGARLKTHYSPPTSPHT
jgi:hypothetical protein